jgi:glycosyltransferase involved in cell wall biosynthesis
MNGEPASGAATTSRSFPRAPRKERVLILGKLPPPYMGPAIATEILLRSELRERYDLGHVDTNVHESIATVGRFSFGNIPTHLAVYGRLMRALRRHRPDLVLIPISQSTSGFLKDSGLVLLSRLFGRRGLLQLRGSTFRHWLGQRPALLRAYVHAILRSAEGMIVLGNNLRPLFSDVYAPDRLFVVPNGLDLIVPRRAPEGNGLRLLHIGNLQSSKGIEDVIRAVALVSARANGSIRLDVVGAWRDDVTKRACLDLARELALPVTFHGALAGQRKLERLASADAFVFTPREPEGHPWVIVEALAAGLPIIATDKGAIVESVIDGTNGFIVADRSPEAIAEAIDVLLADPALRERFGRASRAHYEREFTEARMVERLSDVFDALTGPVARTAN